MPKRKQVFDGEISRLSPAMLLLVGYSSVIAAGAILLMLPVSQASGAWGRVIDMLFTSASAVCVTGLIVVDTPNHFTAFGHVVILLLIQIGGLGYMTAASFLFLVLGKKMSFRDLLALKQGIGAFTVGSAHKLVRLVLITMAIAEGLGFLLLLPVFAMKEGFGKGAWMALFHSVSAFNNAGFALYSDSIMQLNGNPYAILVFAALIVAGGLGFLVIYELYTHRFRNLSLHTKVVLTATGILIPAGMILIFVFEGIAPEGAFAGMSFFDRLSNSFFASVTPRTAGFNSVDYAALHPTTLLLTVVFMLVGGSPGGTAGGFKTTVLAVIYAASAGVMRGRSRTLIFGRKLNPAAIITAFSLLFWALVALSAGATILLFLEHADPLMTVFETASALGTVGLSMGLTPELSTPGKLVVILLMIVGRAGPLTFGLAMFARPDKGNIRFPVEEVLVG